VLQGNHKASFFRNDPCTPSHRQHVVQMLLWETTFWSRAKLARVSTMFIAPMFRTRTRGPKIGTEYAGKCFTALLSCNSLSYVLPPLDLPWFVTLMQLMAGSIGNPLELLSNACCTWLLCMCLCACMRWKLPFMVAICMSACVLDVQFWREAVIPNETFNCILLSSWLNETY